MAACFPVARAFQVDPPVARAFQWQPVWWSKPHTVQPEAFTRICDKDCGMGAQGAIWQDEALEPATKKRQWPKLGGAGAYVGGSVPNALAGGSVPSAPAGGSVPSAPAGGSVPSAPAVASSSTGPAGYAVPVVPTQVLASKRGQVLIRTVAAWQNVRNCDLLVQVGHVMKNHYFGDHDGRDPQVQEQVLGTVQMQECLRNAKNIIRRQFAQKPGSTIRVVIESMCGRHRSIAFGQVLGVDCAEFAHVEIRHTCINRWDKTCPPVAEDQSPAPRNCLILKPELRDGT